MPAFRLSARAVEDLREIGRYTDKRWGRPQRNQYLSEIDGAFYHLARYPHAGRSCDEIREGYRKYRVGRHLVFYRMTDDMVEIIRILHERMDIEGHLM